MKKDMVLEIALLAVTIVVSLVVFGQFDTFEWLVETSRQYEDYEIDEFISVSIVLVFVTMGLLIRRYVKHLRVMSRLENTNAELRAALDDVKTLQGLIPICSGCKKIRDDKGFWNTVEAYVQERSDASFTHSICPECTEKFYGDQAWFSELEDDKAE